MKCQTDWIYEIGPFGFNFKETYKHNDMSFPHITLVWYNMSFWSINLRLHNIILMYWHDQIMIIITVVAWGHTGHTHCCCLPRRSLPCHPRIIIGTSKQPDIFTNKLVSKFWASWKFTDITNFFFYGKDPSLILRATRKKSSCPLYEILEYFCSFIFWNTLMIQWIGQSVEDRLKDKKKKLLS